MDIFTKISYRQIVM